MKTSTFQSVIGLVVLPLCAAACSSSAPVDVESTDQAEATYVAVDAAWEQLDGCATDVKVGVNDEDVWVVGCTPGGTYPSLYRRVKGTWQAVPTPEGVQSFSIDANGNPWIVTSNLEIKFGFSPGPNAVWWPIDGCARFITTGLAGPNEPYYTPIPGGKHVRAWIAGCGDTRVLPYEGRNGASTHLWTPLDVYGYPVMAPTDTLPLFVTPEGAYLKRIEGVSGVHAGTSTLAEVIEGNPSVSSKYLAMKGAYDKVRDWEFSPIVRPRDATDRWYKLDGGARTVAVGEGVVYRTDSGGRIFRSYMKNWRAKSPGAPPPASPAPSSGGSTKPPTTPPTSTPSGGSTPPPKPAPCGNHLQPTCANGTCAAGVTPYDNACWTCGVPGLQVCNPQQAGNTTVGICYRGVQAELSTVCR